MAKEFGDSGTPAKNNFLCATLITLQKVVKQNEEDRKL